MKILLISGHGAGDSGAVGCGYKEADLTRTASDILEGKLAAYDVKATRYPTSRNAYEDNKRGALKVDFSDFGLVIEIHFNSYNGSAYGTEVLYKPSSMKALAAKVSAAISSVGFYDRGAKQRNDLKNMNDCARLGVPYILIETCFIDNKADISLYKAHIYDIWGKTAAAVCSYYGIKKLASTGGNLLDNGWTKKGASWYYMEDGEPVKNKWRKDSRDWCYLGNDGKMCVSRWVKDSKGWCYVGKDGRILRDTWLSWDGGSYFLKKDGHMATGDLDIVETFNKSGKWIGGRQA